MQINKSPKQSKLSYKIIFASIFLLILIGIASVITVNIIIAKDSLNVTADNLQFSPDGRYLMATTSKGIEIWNVSENQITYNKLLHSLEYPRYSTKLAWSPDGKYIAVGISPFENTNISIQVLSWPDGATKLSLNVPDQFLTGLNFSADSTRLITTGVRNQIRDWNLMDGSLLSSITITNNTNAVGSYEGGYLAVLNSASSLVSLVNLQTGESSELYDPSMLNIMAITFSHDGKFLAVGNKASTIDIWDIQSKKIIRTIDNKSDPIWSLVFMGSDDLIIAGTIPPDEGYTNNKNESMHIWQISTGKQINSIKDITGVRHLDFSNSTGYVAGITGGNIRFWKP